MQLNWTSHCKYNVNSMEAETTTQLEFPKGNKASGEINKSKRAGL